MNNYISIKGVPFYYDEMKLSEEDAPKISFNEAKSLLFKTKEILDKLGISFSLIFGTLLGAIREHSFISYDYDIDIMVFDYEKFINSIPLMSQMGLKLCRVTEHRLYSFYYEGFYIDVYIVHEAPSILGKWCYMIGSNTIWKKYLKEFEYVDFLGGSFLVPKNPENVLEFLYGKTWRTPIPGYYGRQDIYPVYIYRKYIKKYLKS